MKGFNARRDFLKKTVLAVTGFTLVPRHVLGRGFLAPSDQLTKAIIGVGGMGRNHIPYEGTKLLAICDVDKNHLTEVLEMTNGDVKAYADYRDVLLRPDIDIIHIATPPHWHGIISAEAARAGKDIWCEKPMTRTIGEGFSVVKAVQQNGSMFRLNTWFRFDDYFYGYGSTVKPVKKIAENRLLGWPLTVTINKSTGFDWKFYWIGKTDLVPTPVPPELDYDMWLGPAPVKPYHPHRIHGTFRGYWDYDGGGLGDMGQHYLDPVQYILEKDNTSPVHIDIDAPQQHPDAAGTWRRIEMTYADGCKIILDGENRDSMAPFISGPLGKLYPQLRTDIPEMEKKLASFPDPEPQVTSFSESVRTRKKFALNENNGFRSCTLVNLAIIAVRLGRPLRFDPEKLEFINDPGANRLIHQPARAPWFI